MTSEDEALLEAIRELRRLEDERSSKPKGSAAYRFAAAREHATIQQIRTLVHQLGA